MDRAIVEAVLLDKALQLQECSESDARQSSAGSPRMHPEPMRPPGVFWPARRVVREQTRYIHICGGGEIITLPIFILFCFDFDGSMSS